MSGAPGEGSPRVVQVNFSERRGGAAVAAARLHTGLRAAGVDSRYLVYKRDGDNPSVTALRPTQAERALRRLMIGRERPDARAYPAYNGVSWSNARLSLPVARHLAALRPDVVHLHWLGDGTLSTEAVGALARAWPLVWTLHDMNPLTGGCHYSGGCTRFEGECGACPTLGSSDADDLSRHNLRRKLGAWRGAARGARLTLVAPSQWLAERVVASAVYRALGPGARVEVIANGLDLARFRPLDARFARQALGLPEDVPLILCGAQHLDDRRKGYAHLAAALGVLAERGSRAEIVAFGGGRLPAETPLPVHHLGALADERLLALAYAAADVFALPSVEDNLPNTAAESLACGTPVVAFAVGGLVEMIDHRQTGYLALPFEVADLGAGLELILDADSAAQRAMRAAARAAAEARYDLAYTAEQYRALYESLCAEGVAV